MNRGLIGILFILAGLGYGSTAIDAVYNQTLGRLVSSGWIGKQTLEQAAKNKSTLGRKPVIYFYSLLLIIIGVFILWNRNS